MLVRLCSKSCMLSFSIMWTKNFQMSKMGLKKAEEPEFKLPTFAGSQRKQGNSRKTYTSVLLPTLKPLMVFSQVQLLSHVWLFATHEPQHTRPPCPSPTPGVYPNPCPLSRWCHPTISSSVVPFSSCPQSFPASGSFPMSQLFTSGGQNIGVSAWVSVLPMNTQDWSPLGWTESPCSPRDSQEYSPIPQFKSINSSALSFFIVQLSHPYMTTGKTIALTRWTFVGKVMSLLFNMLSRLVITFFPRSKQCGSQQTVENSWFNSGRWCGTERPGVLQSMGSWSQTGLGN